MSSGPGRYPRARRSTFPPVSEGIQIRAAAPGEAGYLLPAYEWLFAPPGSTPPQWDERRAEIALEQAIASRDAVVLIAESGTGNVVGFATGYHDFHSVRFGYRCWVEDLAVHPDRRSEGIGAKLLGAARDWARERGATHLELDTAEERVDAQRFYEREGASRRSISYGWDPV